MSFASAQTTVGSGLNNPLGVAVDRAGNVFIADSFNKRVVKVPVGGGAQITVASGFSFFNGLGVDSAGNIFVADNDNDRVVKVPADGGAQTTVGSGLKGPSGLAVDGAGNLFIADYENGRAAYESKEKPGKAYGNDERGKRSRVYPPLLEIVPATIPTFHTGPDDDDSR